MQLMLRLLWMLWMLLWWWLRRLKVEKQKKQLQTLEKKKTALSIHHSQASHRLAVQVGGLQGQCPRSKSAPGCSAW